jgi:superfamily II DNA or RNA helicase
MPLVPSVLERSFSSATRRKGDDYYRSGMVEVYNYTANLVQAGVTGSNVYDVALSRDGALLMASCECPYAQRELEFCKHIWALVLASAERGFFKKHVPGAIELELDGVDDPDDDEPYEADPSYGRSREVPTRRYGAPTPIRPAPPPPPEAAWKRRWREFARVAVPYSSAAIFSRLQVPRDLEYEIDFDASRATHVPIVQVTAVSDGKNRAPARLKRVQLSSEELAALPVDDRDVLTLIGAGRSYGWSNSRVDYSQGRLDDERAPVILRLLVRTGRLFTRSGEIRQGPVVWDDGPPWSFRTRLELDDGTYRLNGRFERDGESIDMTVPSLAMGMGFLLTSDRIALLDRAREAVSAVSAVRAHAELRVPASDADDLLQELSRTERLEIELPTEMGVEELVVDPIPVIRIENGYSQFNGLVSFDYAGQTIAARAPSMIYTSSRQRIRRARDKERAAFALCATLGAEIRDGELRIPKGRAAAMACALAEAGWKVEAEGVKYRKAGSFSMSVSSGIDWFEVDGTIEFDGTATPLAELAEAIGRGERVVTLADGSVGVMPLDRMQRELSLLGLGARSKGGRVRFGRSQLPLIDLLLSARPEISADETVEAARKRLRRFDGSALMACRCAANAAERALCAVHAEPGEGFRGELRPYQREGLAWLRVLEELGLGGCLADDMGLGKTVQVLAHLAGRKRDQPSLVVAPRSVIFNWKDEAARFAPWLRVLDYSGADRVRELATFEGHDLVLTTYGIVRSDAALLAKASFDTVILDESQAIKNASTQTAKAIRLLSGHHRLALTGTPIENHIGELWSLMEFLNPGLLGSSAAFGRLVSSKKLDEEQRQLVARLVRPLLLRRTKDEVAPELPSRVEQTIWCELDAPQKALYVAIRDRYRASLAKQIETQGVARSKIHVLEALLRLRQAACHPRLIDAAQKNTGVKFEALLPQLEEVTREGHKALVFSQFTELLALLRAELDQRGTAYAYLDGKSRDRRAQVERFQTDESLRVFLISLKAGGFGLNLTAADYVFLLDPWWNPAVEAQAIDRTHRIGQTRSVFAYRLVVRDTVEEKILELQAQKRELVESILGGSGSLASQLTAEDVERLLS